MTGLSVSPVFQSTIVWVVAYFVHSTVLLTVAWLGGRWLGDRHLEVQETLWRVALVGGVLTATLQGLFGLRPIVGEIRLADLAGGSGPVPAQALALAIPSTDVALYEAGWSPATQPAEAHQPSSITAGSSTGLQIDVPAIFMIAWALGVAVTMIGLARARIRLARLLRTGRCMPPGRSIRRIAAAMGMRRAFVVTVSPAFAAPFAAGVTRPRICVPDFMVHALAPAEMENLLAHEMAHLARRDPAWVVFYRLLGAVFFFQPLNRLARRRLETLAECLCDDRAVSCTGRPLDLASCLLQVAQNAGLARPVLVAAAVVSQSRLGRRIERLVRRPVGRSRCGPWITVALTAGLLGATVLLPAVSASAVAAPPPALEGGPSATTVQPGAPPSPDEPEAVAGEETVDDSTPLAEAGPQAPSETAGETQLEALVAAERLEMLARLESELAASQADRSRDLGTRQAVQDEILAATAEAATRAIEEHLAALEARTLDLDQARHAVRDEMRALQQRIRELNREREAGALEFDRKRAEAVERQREFEVQALEELELARENALRAQRNFEIQERVERVRELETARQEMERERRLEREKRRQAEQLELERAELQRQVPSGETQPDND